MSRIYHSGGDVMLGSVRLTPEMTMELLVVWNTEAAAAIDALDATAYNSIATLIAQMTVALIEQRKWARCTDQNAA